MSFESDSTMPGSSAPSADATSAPLSVQTQSQTPSVTPDQSSSVPAPSSPASNTPRSQVADSKTPSLTPPKAVANSQQPNSQPEDPVKHLRDELSRRGREMAQMRSDHERVAKEATEMRKHFDQQRQQAEKQKLNRWDPKHPENAKFKDVRSRIVKAQQDIRTMRAPEPPPGMSPEHQAAWKDSYVKARKDEMAAQFEDKDIEEYQAWEADKASYLERLHEDPRAAQREIVRDELREMMREERQMEDANQSIKQDFDDPELGPMIEKHSDEMMDIVTRLGGSDDAYEVSRHMLRQHSMIEKQAKMIAEYSQRQGTMSQQVAEAKTKNDLVKRRASITVDQRPPVSKPPFIEAKEWAEKNGHSMTSEAFQKKVSDLTLARIR